MSVRDRGLFGRPAEPPARRPVFPLRVWLGRGYECRYRRRPCRITTRATASAALIVAAGALATKKQETNTVSRLQKDRDSLEKKLSDLEDKVFEADLQFEQTSGAMREEFQTTLKVKLDTLRSELRREKDMAIKDLKQAQESQLEELKEYVFYVVFSGHFFVSVAAITFYLPACKQILDQALH